jgi:hypothetical protein
MQRRDARLGAALFFSFLYSCEMTPPERLHHERTTIIA